MSQRRYRVLFWAGPLIAFGWLVVALANPDARTRAMEYVSIGLFLGTLFGQTTLASAWMALGPAPLVWRLPLSLIWVAMLTTALALNVGLHGGGPPTIAAVVGCCLLGQWFLVQLPLWGLAMRYGLRLRHVDDIHRTADRSERQFGIRQLLIVTTIVGVIFGIGRLVVTHSGMRFTPDAGPGTAIVLFLAVAAIVITLPLLLAALLPRLSIPAVLLTLVLIGATTALELPLLQRVGSGGGGPNALHFAGINVFTALWILAVVATIRLNGYGLVALTSTVVEAKR